VFFRAGASDSQTINAFRPQVAPAAARAFPKMTARGSSGLWTGDDDSAAVIYLSEIHRATCGGGKRGIFTSGREEKGWRGGGEEGRRGGALNR